MTAIFAQAKMGIPDRLTVSDRSIESGKFEVVTRVNGEVELLSREELFEKFVK